MNHYVKTITLVLSLFIFPCLAKVKPIQSSKKSSVTINQSLIKEFKQEKLSPKKINILRKKVMNLSGKAVPTLVKVMKSEKFPDKSRWLATFSLARIMGKKSSPFLAKFLQHPNWIMRMAAMKSLLALKEKKYSRQYVSALKDKSFIVRRQALETIKKLELKKEAAYVWAMLYDKDNYYKSPQGSKRSNLIKEVVKTIGDLRFEKAKVPLLTMVQKKKYQDIFNEMDYTLSLITGKKSPKGDIHDKRRYWKKIEVMNKVI